MDPRTFIEIIDRHGEVLRRQTIEHLPWSIGRGYDMDLIVDDPHVASCHALIRKNAAGTLEIVDTGSINGVFSLTAGKRSQRVSDCTPVTAEQSYRIGQTMLRIRAASDPVPAELPLSPAPWTRHPATAALCMGAFLLLTVMRLWATEWENPQGVAEQGIAQLLMLYLWVLAWSATSRLVGGRFLHAAHLVAATVTFGGMALLDMAIGGFRFMFALPGSTLLDALVAGLVMTAGIAWHLRLSTRLALPMRSALAATLASVALLFMNAKLLNTDNVPDLVSTQPTLMPPALVVDKGEASEALTTLVRDLGLRVQRQIKEAPAADQPKK